MIARRTPIARTALKRKPRRYVVPPVVLAYWAWIRNQPCVVCGSMVHIYEDHTYSTTEVAHVGLRGLGQKCDPLEVIPLCRLHHARGYPHSHHTLGKKFWTFHGLDRYALIRRFREQYFGLIGHSFSREPESVRQ